MLLFDSIKIVESSEVKNLIVDSGDSLPPSAPDGKLFYVNSDGLTEEGLYLYYAGVWVKQINANTSILDLLPVMGAPNSYMKVNVDKHGLVLSGSNPSTIDEFGITDAQPLNENLTKIGSIPPSVGYLKKNGNNWVIANESFLTGNETIRLTGDINGSGSRDITANLSTTGVVGGYYGATDKIPMLGIDDKGRIFSAENLSPSLDTSAITSGTFPNNRISLSSVKQHESSLSINEAQIINGALLARISDNENITGSWTFNSPASGTQPTLDSHYATKAYVDQIAAGINPQGSVKAATTSNITLSGIQNIDGVNLVAGNRVLVKDQTIQADNGVYVISPSAWTRAQDFDGAPSAEVQTGNLVFVEGGTLNANTSWVVVTQGTIIVGTTSIQFSLFSRAGDYEAGNGLTKIGNKFDVNTASSSRIVINPDNIDLATTGITAGNYSSVQVDAYGRVLSGKNEVIPAVNPTTPKDGDLKIGAGPTISIYATGAWRQIFPAVYS